MKKLTLLPCVFLGIGLLAGKVLAQTDTPYKVLDTTQLMGNGGIDYVYADNDGRRVYVPRGTNTFVFDLDTHKYIGAITNIGGHGAGNYDQKQSRFHPHKSCGHVGHQNDAENTMHG